MTKPRIWALLGQRLGDNKQVLALAEALGMPFEVKTLEYNHWRHLRPGLLGASALSLTARSRAKVSGEPPDMTISAGMRSVPVVQWLRRRSAGRMISIHLGYPRISVAKFDLVVATPEYPIADHANLLRIPFALTRSSATGADPELQKKFPSPRRLLIVGGPTLYWSLPPRTVVESLRALLRRAESDGGSLLVVGSPRTPPVLLESIRREIANSRASATLGSDGTNPSYDALLQAADEIFVTSDSVAMLSDAIMTGKPVGMVPVEQSLLGRAYLALMERLRPGRRVHPRDLRYFWRTLHDQKLAGTFDKPVAASFRDVTSEVVARASALLHESR